MRILLLVLAALGVQAQTSRFAPASNCVNCHSRIPVPPEAVNAAGANVSPYALWLDSAMAAAAIDPYWKAKVRWEVEQSPGSAAAIEDKCLRCHAPMQQYEVRPAHLRLDALNALGAEGVSCTVCHQVQPARLGTKESFTGEFEIGRERLVYGPHRDPFAMPMRMMSGFTPVYSSHLLESSLCGSCHTVILPSKRADGVERGEFVEQGTYLEWLASSYPAAGRTCQSCHVPVLHDDKGELATQYIAHNPMGRAFPPTSPRAPFGQHLLLGGNFQLQGMLGGLLQQDRGGAKARVLEMLQRAVALRASADFGDGILSLWVRIDNLAGHKVPTGFPSRRLWLHVTAFDNGGGVLFESGRWDAERGEIDGLAESTPHQVRITSPADVMIYETEMEDEQGRPTQSLVQAARHRKDNRLLPAGFDLERGLPPGIRGESIAPAGTEGDADFGAGGDQVEFRVPVRAKPARVVVQAYFQSIKPAHVAGMSGGEHADILRFRKLWNENRDPAVIAATTVILP